MCDACEFLEIPDAMWEKSIEEAKKTPATMRQMQKDEMDVRFSVEEDREIKHTKDAIKEVYMQKIKDDFKAEMDLAKLQKVNQVQGKYALQIEVSKVMDNIYIKYNLTLTDLLRAVKHYGLDKDEDVKTLRATQGKARNETMKGLNEMLKLTEDQEQRIIAGVKQ